jgi:hypothetical protein
LPNESLQALARQHTGGDTASLGRARQRLNSGVRLLLSVWQLRDSLWKMFARLQLEQ